MENLSKLPTSAQPSLLSLNESCLLQLFDFLKLEDSMNLSETCVYLCAVANRTFRKYSRMILDEKMEEEEKELFYRFFTRFGHCVLSLVISSPWDCWRIVENCESLKRLKIRRSSGDFENGLPLFTIENLEVLSLVWCDSKFIKSFLNIFRKVKALSVYGCIIECNTLMTALTNSPDMETFEWSGTYGFDFPSLEIISNVERLCLGVELNNVSELDPLLKLKRLSKLKLRCHRTNITSFLSELAKKGIIQELELELGNVAFDENFFEMLQSFDSLQLLVLHYSYIPFYELKSSIVWPPKVKRLSFINFTFTLDAFLSTIKQLKYLKSICFNDCSIVKGEKDNFNDVQKLSQQILAAIDDCDRRQQLDVVLPRELKLGSTKKFLYLSYRLIIYNNIYQSPLDISINFPGMELHE